MGKITMKEHLLAVAVAAKGFATEVALACAGAMEELHNLKADKPKAVNFTIPVDGWEEDVDAESYPLYFDLAVEGVTDKDRATIIIAPAGQEAAIACELCPTSETLTGKIRLRANIEPMQEIPAVYWLEEGRSE